MFPIGTPIIVLNREDTGSTYTSSSDVSHLEVLPFRKYLFFFFPWPYCCTSIFRRLLMKDDSIILWLPVTSPHIYFGVFTSTSTQPSFRIRLPVDLVSISRVLYKSLIVHLSYINSRYVDLLICSWFYVCRNWRYYWVGKESSLTVSTKRVTLTVPV